MQKLGECMAAFIDHITEQSESNYIVIYQQTVGDDKSDPMTSSVALHT